VAFFAHIGGFAFGVLVAFLLSRTGVIDANGGASEARLG
jgi:membrane associated rhomboid family serine protease